MCGWGLTFASSICDHEVQEVSVAHLSPWLPQILYAFVYQKVGVAPLGLGMVALFPW